VRSLSEVFVGVPMSGVKHGCRKAREEGVIVMIVSHSGRNMMAEWWVLQHEGEEQLVLVQCKWQQLVSSIDA